MARLPSTRAQQVIDYLKAHPDATNSQVCKAVGLSRRQYVSEVRDKCGLPSRKVVAAAAAASYKFGSVQPGQREVTEEHSDKQHVITVKSCDLRTVDDVLKFSHVDTTVWRVERFQLNSWEVTMKHSPVTVMQGGAASGEYDTDEDGHTVTIKEPAPFSATTTHRRDTYTNYQVKVWLERTVSVEEQDALNNIITSMRAHAPKYPIIKRVPRPQPTEKFLYEIAASVDPHLARMSWGKETGVDWDMAIATRVLVRAVDDLLVRAKPYNIERILLPIGNDTFEINDPTNQTPRNHNALYVDGRYIHVFERGYDCLRTVVEHCLEVAPVQILWIPGNHDPQTSYHVVRIIEEHFSKTGDVTVDRTPPSRKALVYGPTFLGFTHGVDIGRKDVAAIFLSEFREMVAKARHVEIHLGHKHQMRETRTVFGNTEIGGVRTRVLQSLAARSNWEFEQGFTNFQCAEAYLWSDNTGYAGHHNVYARPEEV